MYPVTMSATSFIVSRMCAENVASGTDSERTEKEASAGMRWPIHVNAGLE